MLKKMLIDDILNDNETENVVHKKGVCQRCGHYTMLNKCRLGMKVCGDCEKQMEKELKRDYL